MFTAVPGDDAKRLLAGAPFGDVHWVAETGSTNADVLAVARDGAAAGYVLVAEHQTGGRGRAGRSWVAPAGSSLLVSVLARPPAAVAPLCSMAMGLAAVDAVHEVAGVRARLKWPNDVVWPGDGSADDRKVAGILAEAHWPADGEVAVVVGIGINVNWPDTLPDELREIAVALNHVAGATVDREALLVALLQRFGRWYEELGRPSLLDAWRAASATLGRRVRVDLGHEVVEGVARDITDDGYLVVDGRTFAVGDVVHVRAVVDS